MSSSLLGHPLPLFFQAQKEGRTLREPCSSAILLSQVHNVPASTASGSLPRPVVPGCLLCTGLLFVRFRTAPDAQLNRLWCRRWKWLSPGLCGCCVLSQGGVFPGSPAALTASVEEGRSPTSWEWRSLRPSSRVTWVSGLSCPHIIYGLMTKMAETEESL